MKLFLLIICVAYAASPASSSNFKKKTLAAISDVKFLPIPEKLGLLLLSNLKPQKFSYLTKQSLFDPEEDLPFIDYFFVDFRSLLIQAIKVKEDIPLPELDWSFDFDFCIPPWICFEDTVTITTANTKMTGQQRTSSVNEVSPTQFKNSFHAPLFVWQSSDFLLNITDTRNGDQFLFGDLNVALSDLAINTTFGYTYVPDVGIQISNLTIDFGINYLRTNIENITTIYGNGNIVVESPIKGDFTESFESDWKYNREEYQTFLEKRTNCILSGFLDGCEVDTSDASKQFHRMNILQLIETIGLGSMDRI